MYFISNGNGMGKNFITFQILSLKLKSLKEAYIQTKDYWNLDVFGKNFNACLFFSFLFIFSQFHQSSNVTVPTHPVPIRVLPPSRAGTPLFSVVTPFQKSRSVPRDFEKDLHLYTHLTTLEKLDESPANSVSALIVAPPSADAFRRAHRHSIPGHRLNNYLKFLHELKSTTAQLFSTAVISGSSSAPNLQEAMAGVPLPGANVGKFWKTNDILQTCKA